MEINEKQVSKNIKACRAKIGKSQREVADMLKITKATYNYIENHPFEYPITKLNYIAKILGFNISDFFKEF